MIKKYKALNFCNCLEKIVSTLRLIILIAVKPVYNDYLCDPIKVALVDRWYLKKGHLCYKSSKSDRKMVVIVDRWSLERV